MGDETSMSNFLTAIIDGNRVQGLHGGKVVTRFPPEPNGYLHIGHAKSICLNFGLAAHFGGVCNLRFDDTNPVKEDDEYVRAIQADVRWLGFEWDGPVRFASDYFETMAAYAESLITQGFAYVDDQDVDAIRAGRGTLTTPGTNSPFRERTAAENLDLFRRMKAGEFADGACVLRAKIDMTAANMMMRDPLLYRIRHATHHRTGDAWCIYPIYDFAHCIEDAIEGVTHSVCTLEFENNRELYNWTLEHVLPEAERATRPRQYEFARLSLEYTIMSKRKFLQLVEQERVSGWDDPRMPTISGMRRRGYRADAIRAFCNMIGVAKANSTVDFAKLEYAVRADLNAEAPRVMAVLDPLKVVITNYPEGETEALKADYWPHDIPKTGSRMVPFGREILIERADFMEVPVKGFHRLAPGAEVRLRYGYFLRCEGVVHDENGAVIALNCTYDSDTKGGQAPDGRKVKGTIHWVSATDSLPCEVRVYERLFSTIYPGSDPDVDFVDELNPNSLLVHPNARVEPSVASDEGDTRYQFERLGYFWRDSADGRGDSLVFNRIVGLRDSWAKQAKKSAGKFAGTPAVASKSAPKSARAAERPQKRSREAYRAKAREDHPSLAAAFARFEFELGLSTGDADVLSGDEALVAFFEAALAAHPKPAAVARWTLNEVLREAKERSIAELPFDGAALGKLVALADSGRLSNAMAKKVFAEMAKNGGDAEAIVEAKGLSQVDDREALLEAIDAVIAQQADAVARFKAGEKKLQGFLMGQVMKATKGKANPGVARTMLMERLA